jgi:hypothetical protein
MKVEDYLTENAVVDSVNVGSLVHDGRAFFSLGFSGSCWGQGATPGWDRHAHDGFTKLVDGIVRACDATDLAACKGKYVRVLRLKEGGPIVGIAHIVDDAKVVSFLTPERHTIVVGDTIVVGG